MGLSQPLGFPSAVPNLDDQLLLFGSYPSTYPTWVSLLGIALWVTKTHTFPGQYTVETLQRVCGQYFKLFS